MIDPQVSTKDGIDRIREITDERVQELLEHIKPLAPNPDDGGALYEIELPADLRHTAFRWSPKFTKKADLSRYHVLETLVTYHSCGYIGLFKPDIPEVLAQIDQLPDEIRYQVVAFDVLFDGLEMMTADFYGHKTKTVLYRTKDDCTRCNGDRGGVHGNENVIDGKAVCDYCS
jgi:hypothetical protein